MKFSKLFGALAAGLFAAALCATNAEAGAWAGGFPACATQAKGDQLAGVAFITFDQTTASTVDDLLSDRPPICNQPTDLEATIRLKDKSGLVTTFFTVVHVDEDVCNPCTVMAALLNDPSLKNDILNTYFGGDQTKTIGIKEVTDASYHEERFTDGFDQKVRYRTLANVVVTVK